jgi:hypothetical protein
MTAHEQRRQKKLEKHRAKRAAAKQELARRQAHHSGGLTALVRAGAAAPFGPCWVSSALGADDDPMPALITVIVTRQLRARQLLAHVALVDRTCLGVKNAFVMAPGSESDMELRAQSFGESGDTLERCDPLVAQSVVFHAVDFARALGFEPHRDFEEALFGPRPSELVDTPLARPERPCYIAGPSDDAIASCGGSKRWVAPIASTTWLSSVEPR